MPPKKSATSGRGATAAAKARSTSSSLGRGGTKPSSAANRSISSSDSKKKGKNETAGGFVTPSLSRGDTISLINLDQLADSPDSSFSRDDLKAVKDRPDLDVDDPAFDGYWNVVQEKMGLPRVKPIHSEGYNRVQHMLRVFDLDPNYGPTIGMTRLQRWHRAKALGEEPPEEIRAILETKQGMLLYKDNLFVGTGV